MIMKRVLLFLLITFFTTNAFSLVKIDITRGNLEPLPTAISNFYIDNPEKFTEKIKIRRHTAPLIPVTVKIR